MINTEILQDIYTDHNLCGPQKRELVKTIAMIKQGRLIELPCAVGEDAYFIIENYIYGEVGDKSELHRQIFKRPFSLYDYVKHGKRAYTSKEEAEAKLKELEGVKE